MHTSRWTVKLAAAVVGLGLAIVLSAACRNPNSAESRQEFWTAILENDTATVQRLLEAGLDPNEQPTEACSTPLALAAIGGDPQIVQLIVNHGANVNAPASPDGQTVLHCVVSLEQDAADMAGMLISGGVEVNAADDQGRTALMLAAERGHVETVTMLLEVSPDLNLKTAAGKTAIELAAAANHVEIVSLLRRAGARLPLPPPGQEEEFVGSSGITSIATENGMIELGETFEEAAPKLETGMRLDLRQVSPTRNVEIRRFNNQTYRLTYERDGKTGPFRLVRIDLQ